MAAALAGCSRDASNPAPPRETAPIAVPQERSAIAVPISTSLAELQRLANAKVPRPLITINEVKPACLRVKAIGSISCRLVGAVTRGPIKVGGAGDTIVATMPASAIVAARIDHVHNGLVYPAGQGLFMPVDAVGTASVRFAPKPR